MSNKFAALEAEVERDNDKEEDEESSQQRKSSVRKRGRRNHG